MEVVDHEVQLVLAPRLGRCVAIDVFETQRDPAVLVISPQQPRHPRFNRNRRHDLRLSAVKVGGVRIRPLADRFDETTAAIAGAQSRRQPRRETARLRLRFHNSIADTLFDRGPYCVRQLLPVDANTLGRRWARRRHPGAASGCRRSLSGWCCAPHPRSSSRGSGRLLLSTDATRYAPRDGTGFATCSAAGSFPARRAMATWA